MIIKLVNKQKGDEIGDINLQFLPRKGEFIKFKGKEFTVLTVNHNEDYIILDVYEKSSPLNKLGAPNSH